MQLQPLKQIDHNLDCNSITPTLNFYDYIVLIDNSGSMKAENRWSHLQYKIGQMAISASLFNKKSLDVCFFNHKTEWIKNVDSINKVNELFEAHIPEGCTNTTFALQQAFNKHFYRKKKNSCQKTKITLFTDGAPDDEKAVIQLINQIYKKLSITKNSNRNHELMITIYQLGFDQKMQEFYNSLTHNFPHLIYKGDINDININL